MPSTSRLSIPYPAGSDPVDVNGDLQAAVEVLDDAALADQGLLSAIPAAGTMGRLYRATDNGKVYWDTGAAWVAASAATATADLDDAAVTTGKLADAAVTSAKLKPTVHYVQASGDLTLSASLQDVPGATVTFTPAVASTLIVSAIFDFELNPNSFVLGEDVHAIGGVDVNGSMLGAEARFQLKQNVAGATGTTKARATVSCHATVGAAATAKTVKLRAVLAGAISGTAKALMTNTSLLLWVVSQ